MFIGGLSFETNEESLAEAFGKYGTIEKGRSSTGLPQRARRAASAPRAAGASVCGPDRNSNSMIYSFFLHYFFPLLFFSGRDPRQRDRPISRVWLCEIRKCRGRERRHDGDERQGGRARSPRLRLKFRISTNGAGFSLKWGFAL